MNFLKSFINFHFCKLLFVTAPARLLGVMALIMLPGLTSAATTGVAMASYRAIYDVSLADEHKNENFAEISGRVVYNFQKVCGGWIMQQESAMELQLLEGGAVPEYSLFSSWEADDGSRYRFSLSRNEDIDQTILGDAVMAADGGEVSFQKPEKTIISLPKEVMFPTAHTIEMIKRARSGQTQFNAISFDGSEVDGAKLISAFVSKLATDSKYLKNPDLGELIKRPGWTVHLAYFNQNNPTPEPVYEIEVDLLDNGIATRWLLGFGSYGAEMILKQIEPIPASGC